MKSLLLVLVMGCATTASTEQTTTPLSGVPGPAAATLQSEAGGAKIEAVEHETEGGADLYEGRWFIDGRAHEVTVKADGTVVEREEELAPDQVPQPVRVAALAALPGAQKLVFVKLMSGNYEAEGVIDGKEREVTVSPTGQVVTDDDGDDDVGDDKD